MAGTAYCSVMPPPLKENQRLGVRTITIFLLCEKVTFCITLAELLADSHPHFPIAAQDHFIGGALDHQGLAPG